MNVDSCFRFFLLIWREIALPFGHGLRVFAHVAMGRTGSSSHWRDSPHIGEIRHLAIWPGSA